MITINKHFPFIHKLTDEDMFNLGWAEATDEEKQLLELTALELARLYQEAKVTGDEAKCMLIAHYLSLRLVTMQVNATKRASYIAILGTILGVVLGFALSILPKCF